MLLLKDNYPAGNVYCKKREVTHLSIFLAKSKENPLVAESEFGKLNVISQIYLEHKTKLVKVQ